MEDVFDYMEHVFHLTANTGFSLFQFLLFFPCQAVPIMQLECAALTIDSVFSGNVVRYMIFQFAISGISIDGDVI